MLTCFLNITPTAMDRKLKILYAEDNRITAQEITEALEEHGYEVQTVFDGDEAWQAFQERVADVVLLDQNMPCKSGADVFLLIRKVDAAIPVLILSSYTELCASMLKIGTNDFIRKDAGIDEVCARIEAAWRRSSSRADTSPANNTYQLSASSSYQSSNSTLNIGGQTIPLNGMLAELLTILCQNRDQYLSQKYICKRIWNNDTSGKVALLRDYISKLRQILKEDPDLEICSSYGRGYCLKTSAR